jgi:hypothetical protein
VVEQTNGISRDESSKRVSDDAYFLDIVSAPGQLLQLFLNFVGEALAAELDAIVGKTAAVAFRDEYVKVILGVLLTERGGDKIQVIGIAPEPTVALSANKRHCSPSRLTRGQGRKGALRKRRSCPSIMCVVCVVCVREGRETE